MNTSVAEKRPLGALGRMGVVAGLHAGALYLIAASLGMVPALKLDPAIPITVIEDRVVPEDPVPQPAKPTFQETRLTVEKPEVPPIDTRDDTQVIGADIIEGPVAPPDTGTAEPQHVLVAVRQDTRFPLSQPTYPAKDIREGNEGTVDLEVYVLPTGRIGDVRVLKSTGSATLDQSAMEEAKRRWKLMPATRDGEPYAQWYKLRVTFNLKNR